MRRYLLIAIALVFCAAAAADVRVFVTSSASGYGLNEPANAFIPTFSTVDVDNNNFNAYDFYHSTLGPAPNGQGFSVSNFPPIAAPSGTVDTPILINAAAGEWGYIWFQFRNERRNAQVNEMITVATLAGQSQSTQNLNLTYYVQNDFGGTTANKRWRGTATPPDYPEWRVNPKHFVTNYEQGIVNGGDDPPMMFDNQAINGTNRTGVALLGALWGAPRNVIYELRLTLAARDFD